MRLKSLARLTKRILAPPSSSRDHPKTKTQTPSISFRSLSSSSDHSGLMEDPTLSAPISYSTSADDAFLLPDTTPQIGSASGSFQNEGILSGGGGGGGGVADGGGSGSSSDAEFGFQRTEFGQGSLVGTVQIYDRHIFLCYKTPQVWPPHVEAAEFDRLPRLLSAALKSRKADMKKRTRLTICEGEDGTESSNGDVLIFPDMIRYRRLTHFDVDNFVEEVLVKDTVWLPGVVETLERSYVFVCSHGSRDRRCGVCGPALIKRFNEDILARGLEGHVSVSACSHIGGHKYAGNVIIFSQNVEGEVTGHWYGYVSPDDVPVFLEQHIGKGEVVAHLWRGQMGLSEEDQKKFHELQLQLKGEAERKETNPKEPAQVAELVYVVNVTLTEACCQGNGNSSCCQNQAPEKVMESQKTVEKKSTKENKGSSSTRKICSRPIWFEFWEREDTYAAVSVAIAVFSVAVAYSYYRNL